MHEGSRLYLGPAWPESAQRDLFWPGFTESFYLQRTCEKKKQMELGLLVEVLKRVLQPKKKQQIHSHFFSIDICVCILATLDFYSTFVIH